MELEGIKADDVTFNVKVEIYTKDTVVMCRHKVKNVPWNWLRAVGQGEHILPAPGYRHTHTEQKLNVITKP